MPRTKPQNHTLKHQLDLLETSELRYRRLFETAQDGILIIDFKTGMILDANKFLIDLLDYSKIDFLEKYLWEIGIFKDIAASKRNFSTLQKKRYVRFEDLPLETKSGKKINVEFVANAYEVGDSTVIQCNVRDITDRKKAEQRLAIAKSKDEAILASIGEGIIAVDEEMKIILVNKAAEVILGWKAIDLIGKDFFNTLILENEEGKIISREKRSLITAFKAGTITTSSTTGPSYQYVRKDKTTFTAAVVVTPIVLNDKIIGAIDVFHDNSKEKAIDKAKTEIVSLAAHQLRTPVASINWCLEMLMSGDYGKLTEQQLELAEKINIASKEMIDLINSLLNISLLELGNLNIESKTINVIEIAKNCIEELTSQIAIKKLVIKEKYGLRIPTISADPKLLTVVISNLLSNAIKYTPKQGKVELAISKEKNAILITVTDTGIGIPKANQEKIFTRFFRADNAKTFEQGTGLGLYLAKEILDKSGGKIWFKSKLKKGTIFYVLLPLLGMASNS